MLSSEKWPLVGRRVLLKPLQMENVHTHFRWNNDPELNRLDSEAPFTPEPLGAFLKRFERLVYAPSPGDRDLEIHTHDGVLIGVAFIDRLSETNRHGRVGLTIGERAFWRQGYGRETLSLLLPYLFDTLRLHRVSAESFAFNRSWIHILQSLGFQRESLLRDYLFRENRYWDKLLFSLLDREYRLPSPTSHKTLKRASLRLSRGAFAPPRGDRMPAGDARTQE